MIDFSNYYVWDLETYPNVFTAVFANETKKKIWVFEISDRKDDSARLYKFLKKLYKDKSVLCGFNSLGFDYPLIHYWLTNKNVTALDLYNHAQEIINSMREDTEERFKYVIRSDRCFLSQCDLYKIHHFDNRARATSLKMIEFNMRSDEIEDLPYKVGAELSHDQIDNLIKYNKKDVIETLKFFNKSKGMVEFRKTMSDKYGVDYTNHSDGKLGKDFFRLHLEKIKPDACYFNLNGKRIKRQTKRKVIDFSDIVFDYIEFTTPAFKALLDWIKKQVISSTKSVFSGIEEHDLGELAKYSEMIVKSKKLKTKETADRKLYRDVRKMIRAGELSEKEILEKEDEIYGLPDQDEVDTLFKLHPLGWIERNYLSTGKTCFDFKWRVAESLNVVINGFVLVYGTGGLHASVKSKTYESNNEWVILDYDYASMYPNIFISNRVHPEHLGEEFCDIYQNLYLERKKHKKGTDLNLALKLALNNVFGDTNNQHSVFYDPRVAMQVTVNGQLTLSCLTERLTQQVPDLEMIQCNTDGLTVYVKRDKEKLVDNIVKNWDKQCGLVMEKASYSKMAIADVNNYIAVYDFNENIEYRGDKANVKLNGRYEFRRDELGWHQNHSALIIKEAAVKCILEKIPVETTIKKCKDPYDFMLRTKVPRSSRLELHFDDGNITKQQNITRYYVANNGGSLIKVMPPTEGTTIERTFNVESGWLTKTCNNMKDFDWDINYDYYIQEANKLVKACGVIND